MSSSLKVGSTQTQPLPFRPEFGSSKKLPPLFDNPTEEKQLVLMYFRHKLSSFIKVVEEKSKSALVYNKGSSIKKGKPDGQLNAQIQHDNVKSSKLQFLVIL